MALGECTAGPAEGHGGLNVVRRSAAVFVSRWSFGFCIVGMLALIFYDQLVAGVPWSGVGDTLTRPDNRYRLAGLGLLGLLFCVGGWFHGLLTLVAVATLAAFITAKPLGWYR